MSDTPPPGATPPPAPAADRDRARFDLEVVPLLRRHLVIGLCCGLTVAAALWLGYRAVTWVPDFNRMMYDFRADRLPSWTILVVSAPYRWGVPLVLLLEAAWLLASSRLRPATSKDHTLAIAVAAISLALVYFTHWADRLPFTQLARGL
ncbi:MAG: hypothetical protein IT370_01355 [Deltaproteobacteria bacterium]|nr:hypothetical protein [Deltaproteobacteria bacterium]